MSIVQKDLHFKEQLLGQHLFRGDRLLFLAAASHLCHKIFKSHYVL